MKIALIPTTLALVLIAGLSATVLQAKGPRHSSAHEAAVQKCGDAYEAAAAAAHAPKSPTGNTRKHAMHAAAEAKKQCVARAPK